MTPVTKPWGTLYQASYKDLSTGKVQSSPPPGTVSLAEKLTDHPWVGTANVFFSHAWNEGVFEFIDNALAAWPDDLAGDDCGAYICFLSNPQVSDVLAKIGLAGARPTPSCSC